MQIKECHIKIKRREYKSFSKKNIKKILNVKKIKNRDHGRADRAEGLPLERTQRPNGHLLFVFFFLFFHYHFVTSA